MRSEHLGFRLSTKFELPDLVVFESRGRQLVVVATGEVVPLAVGVLQVELLEAVHVQVLSGVSIVAFQFVLWMCVS